MSDGPQHPVILASDAERERTVAVLQEAVVDGRLTLEEFSGRVELAHAARTDQDLAALGADLPAIRQGGTQTDTVRHRALCSRLSRSGLWDIPQRTSWRCLFGTIILDLRQARLTAAETSIEIFNLFGTVTVIVPAGVRVEVSGGGAFASQVIQAPSTPPADGAPVLRISTSGPGGTLHVRHRDEPGRWAKLLGQGNE
jgi:hypothetical protein